MEIESGTRINKYLSEHGVMSRRRADQELASGIVLINGRPAVPGDRVMPGDEVTYKGRLVREADDKVILMVNKPVGVVCTAEKREKNNIIDYVGYPVRVYPIGRLDKDSSGLLLLTNRGDLANEITRAGGQHEKEYVVRINKPVTEEFLRQMAGGVPLRELKTRTAPCIVKKVSKFTFSIILTQGLNRQIRRMCEFFGARVVELKRIRIMTLTLGDLKEGEWRPLTDGETEELLQAIK